MAPAIGSRARRRKRSRRDDRQGSATWPVLLHACEEAAPAADRQFEDLDLDGASDPANPADARADGASERVTVEGDLITVYRLKRGRRLARQAARAVRPRDHAGPYRAPVLPDTTALAGTDTRNALCDHPPVSRGFGKLDAAPAQSADQARPV